MILEMENFLLQKTYDALKTTYEGIVVTNDYPQKSSVLPCVTLNEIDNYPIQSNATAEELENYTKLTYEIGIYCDGEDKKAKAKAIADIINTTFSGYGFIRTYLSAIPNLDSSIHRIMMRFTGTVSRKDSDGKQTIFIK